MKGTTIEEDTVTDRDESNEETRYESAFPDNGGNQLGDVDPNTVVDEPVRDGLDNAVENSQVRTRDDSE